MFDVASRYNHCLCNCISTNLAKYHISFEITLIVNSHIQYKAFQIAPIRFKLTMTDTEKAPSVERSEGGVVTDVVKKGGWGSGGGQECYVLDEFLLKVNLLNSFEPKIKIH